MRSGDALTDREVLERLVRLETGFAWFRVFAGWYMAASLSALAWLVERQIS